MKKISTLFKKDPNDLSRVTSEIDPDNLWVFESGIPTRKFDGTACMIVGGEFYKRYDVKKGRIVPKGGIPCQEPDPITGHWPHWVPVRVDDPADKYHWQAFDLFHYSMYPDGTYELVGPKINSNHEHYERHELVMHGIHVLTIRDMTREGIITYLTLNDIEGIVFHDSKPTGRMCKIRKSDFGIKRN